VTCSDRTGTFRVRLIESNQEATGGSFILRGNNPTVNDVEPTFVQADATGNYVTPSDITIFGDDFSDTLLVEINDFVMSSSAVTVVNENTIEVTGIPAPNDFGLVFDTAPCITDDGLIGQRQAPTAVNVSVVNLPGNCRSTLAGGLIYEPGDDTCVASAGIEVIPPVFPAAQAGSCSSADIVVTNTGAGTLEVFQMNLIGRFFFDGAASSQVAAGFSVAPLSSSAPMPVYFCPDADNGSVYSGQLTIQNSSPTNPYTVSVSGTEAFPAWNVNGGTAPVAITCPDTPSGGGPVDCTPTVTIENTGTARLNWTLVKTGANPSNFFIQGPPPDRFVDPGTSVVYTVRFSPDATGLREAVLTITANESDAQPVLIDLNASGNGT
jgi:hypothetical protein